MSYSPDNKIVTKILNFLQAHAKFFFVFCSVLFFALAPGLTQFAQKYDVRIWFLDSDPLIQTLNEFERQFGNDESVVIALKTKGEGDLFSAKNTKIIQELTEKMWHIPQVIRVESLTNYNDSYANGDEIIVEPFVGKNSTLTKEYLAKRKTRALNHEVLPNYLISEDAKSAMLFARLIPTLNGSPDYGKIVEKTKSILSELGSNELEFHILGEAAVNDAFRTVANADGAIFLPLLFALIIGYLFLIFRSFSAMLLPLGVTAVTLLSTFGLCFYIGGTYNNILAILPAILIAISIADSVHIMVTYYNMRLDHDRTKAAYLSLHKNFIPTFLTSISTMIGFFSLTFTELMPVRQLGLMAGIGCFMAWVVTIFMMGPLLFWLELKVPKHFLKVRNTGESTSDFAKLWTKRIRNNRYLIVIVFTFIAIASVFLGSQITVNSDPYKYFVEGMPIRDANEFVKKEFGGNTGPEFIIDAGAADAIKDPLFLSKVETFKNWLNQREEVNKTIDIIDIIKDMNRTLHEGDETYYKIPETQDEIAQQLFLYSMSLPQGMDLNNRMTLSKDKIRLSVLWDIYDSKGWLTHIELYLKKAKEIGLKVEATGKFYLFQRMMDYIVKTFAGSITMAMVLVSLLMMVFFKSFKIGLISVIPNILPLFLGAAFMSLFNINLNIGSALVFSVCLGIAVDDTIHFLSNYIHYRRSKHSVDETIGIIFTHTAQALVITTVILVSAFGVYMLGDFIPNINFGALCALVLISALIIDLVFLPALLMILDRQKT